MDVSYDRKFAERVRCVCRRPYFQMLLVTANVFVSVIEHNVSPDVQFVVDTDHDVVDHLEHSSVKDSPTSDSYHDHGVILISIDYFVFVLHRSWQVHLHLPGIDCHRIDLNEGRR